MTICTENIDSKSGYVHSDYAQSLSELGSPLELVRCGGWVIERRIPGSSYNDAMGCYPLFQCRDWQRLDEDLENMKKDIVSLSLVTDPFGDYDQEYLKKCFMDVVVPFKESYVIDLSRSTDSFVSEHHKRYAKKSLGSVDIEVCENPAQYRDEWSELYAFLIEKRGIKGIASFSRDSFAQQLNVPGLKAFRALHNGETIGMILWYIHGRIAYYHLGAYNSFGYKMHASFALFSKAIDYFMQNGFKWINMGGGSGLRMNKNDGLANFKKGWATETKTAFFCGHIFDRHKYEELSKKRGVLLNDYFPAYRENEFG